MNGPLDFLKTNRIRQGTQKYFDPIGVFAFVYVHGGALVSAACYHQLGFLKVVDPCGGFKGTPLSPPPHKKKQQQH